MRIIRYRSSAGNAEMAEEHTDGRITRLNGSLFSGLTRTADALSKDETADRLAPLEPTALLCIGLNYRQHAAETNAALPRFPVLFMKSTAALQHPGQPIVLPRFLHSSKVDYEAELAVVVGRTCKNVRREEAMSYVFGYICANDVSARDWQKEGGGSQWSRGKSFDTFAPLGPCLVTADEIENPHALRIRTVVSGETLQDCSTGDMVFDIPTLIEFLSGSTTLLPGTVILTGTPHGVGMARTPPRFLKPGDLVTVEIDRIGALTNPVFEEVSDTSSDFVLPK